MEYCGNNAPPLSTPYTEPPRATPALTPVQYTPVQEFKSHAPAQPLLPRPTSVHIVKTAASMIDNRSSERDRDNGEKSMARTVRAFNALAGTSLTEEQGWLFMVMVKAARALGGGFKDDDYIDMSAYAGLMGEAAGKERK